MARKFEKVAAQGEITIIRLGPVPKRPRPRRFDCSPLPLENGKFVIGHSETGHHHVLDRTEGASVTVLDKPPEGMRILHAILKNPTMLEHERPFDKHESIELPPGEYEFRIAREFDPYAEVARLAAD